MDTETVGRAARLLREGQVVGVPTETVYGLACDASNPDAIKKVFGLKRRPQDNPLILHASGLEMVCEFLGAQPGIVHELAAWFWPGPLTLLLPRPDRQYEKAAAGRPLVGIRVPDHPLFLELIQAFSKPVAAPSANLSTRPSPTTAMHVMDDFPQGLPLVLNGGRCRGGLESTVLDPLSQPPRILRPGLIEAESLRRFLPNLEMAYEGGALHGAESPGLKYRHYSPSVPLLELLPESDARVGVLLCFEANRQHYEQIGFQTISLGQPDPAEVAYRLFFALREAEKIAKDCIYIVPMPSSTPWRAVRNRLKRALQQG